MKKLIPALACALLAGCASGPRIDTTYATPQHSSRIRFLVLHYTEANFEQALRILTGPDVSAHYLVRESPPTIFQLADENRQTYHAGVSSWRGYTYLNATSVGIEIDNRGGDPSRPAGWAPWSEAQIDLVLALARDIVRRHNICRDCIVGHSDIAPQRKVDPGPLFPWKRFADAGLIRWPDPAIVARRLAGFQRELPDVGWFQATLARHGFEVPRHGELDEPTRNVIRAFQMKYRPARYDGEPDAETAAILDVLVNP